MVLGPLSHRIEPSVRPPAIASIRGPIAASTTDGAGTSPGPPTLSTSPDQMVLQPHPPLADRRQQHREVLIHVACGVAMDRATPRPTSCGRGRCRAPAARRRSRWSSRPGRPASGGVGSTSGLPRYRARSRPSRSPTTASTVSASGTASCATQYDEKPLGLRGDGVVDDGGGGTAEGEEGRAVDADAHLPMMPDPRPWHPGRPHGTGRASRKGSMTWSDATSAGSGGTRPPRRSCPPASPPPDLASAPSAAARPSRRVVRTGEHPTRRRHVVAARVRLPRA